MINNISIIVAVANNGAIGKNGDLLWHIHEDMLFFKRTTRNHPVVMGRKTWESLQVRPLPKRQNIVITHDKDFAFENVTVFHSLQEFMSRKDEIPSQDNEIFVIGGGTVYKEMLPVCSKIYLTRVFAEFEDADTFFPPIDKNIWSEKEKSEVFCDSENGLKYQFIVLSKNQ